MDVYVEAGSKKVVAGAIDWPGWCRIAKTEETALEALAAYAGRYAAVLPRRLGFRPGEPLEVVERLQGDATTDFGAPSIAPAADARPLDAAEAERQAAILGAAWAAFDAATEAGRGRELKKGPRGGGRELDAIVDHVVESDRAYLGRLWSGLRLPKDDVGALREAMLERFAARAAGEPAPATRGRIWSPRYTVRRSAWHVLDHAWEIEDRATP